MVWESTMLAMEYEGNKMKSWVFLGPLSWVHIDPKTSSIWLYWDQLRLLTFLVWGWSREGMSPVQISTLIFIPFEKRFTSHMLTVSIFHLSSSLSPYIHYAHTYINVYTCVCICICICIYMHTHFFFLNHLRVVACLMSFYS